jgi:hypothetical protein
MNAGPDASRMQSLLDSDIRLRALLESAAARRNLSLAPRAVYSHWLHRKLRLACFKINPGAHPFAGDNALGLCASLLRSVWSAAELSLRSRLLFSGWGVLTALLPSPLASPLVCLAYSPGARPAALKGVL